MIEINKQAKPYNPCESVIGTELLFTFVKSCLTGSHYYQLKPKSKNKDVLALARSGRWSSTCAIISRNGWKEIDGVAVPGYYTFTKTIDDCVNQLIVTHDSWQYDKWKSAGDVCRLMNLDGIEDYKHLALGIYKVLVEGYAVDFKPDGSATLKFEQEYDMPEMAGNMGLGFGQQAAPIAQNAWGAINAVFAEGAQWQPAPEEQINNGG